MQQLGFECRQICYDKGLMGQRESSPLTSSVSDHDTTCPPHLEMWVEKGTTQPLMQGCNKTKTHTESVGLIRMMET